jgi:hypothetical protein
VDVPSAVWCGLGRLGEARGVDQRFSEGCVLASSAPISYLFMVPEQGARNKKDILLQYVFDQSRACCRGQ